MRNQAPTLAPGQPASDVTVHIVLNDFGDLGRAYVETDEAEADEATIIENILSGQHCAERAPLNLDRHAEVFSEDARRGCADIGLRTVTAGRVE